MSNSTAHRVPFGYLGLPRSGVWLNLSGEWRVLTFEITSCLAAYGMLRWVTWHGLSKAPRSPRISTIR